jgi:hypothetical protein
LAHLLHRLQFTNCAINSIAICRARFTILQNQRLTVEYCCAAGLGQDAACQLADGGKEKGNEIAQVCCSCMQLVALMGHPWPAQPAAVNMHVLLAADAAQAHPGAHSGRVLHGRGGGWGRHSQQVHACRRTLSVHFDQHMRASLQQLPSNGMRCLLLGLQTE